MSNGSWIICKYVSKSEVDCNGYTVTLNGETVTLSPCNLGGKILNSGDKTYDMLVWHDGFDWIKQGNLDTKVTCVILEKSFKPTSAHVFFT